MESISDSDRSELEFYNEFWRLMRLLGPDEDIFEETMDTYGSTVTGFYEPDEDTLVLVEDGTGEALSFSEEFTIAHEYVHSLQDAAYDLSDLDSFDESEDERATTIHCVVEGDASVAAMLFISTEYDDWLTRMQEVSEAGDDSDETGVPAIVLEYTQFNYDECFSYVFDVFLELGWDGVNAMFTRPPTTTEQVLHADKYLAGEPALTMTETDLSEQLGDGWRLEDAGAYGEFDVLAYLLAGGARLAYQGADGWGGGRGAYYMRGDAEDANRGVLMHLSLKWDTRDDFDEFAISYRGLLEQQGWNMTEDGGDWHWWHGTDAGYAMWDATALQVDIVLSTDALAAEAARDALQSQVAVRQ